MGGGGSVTTRTFPLETAHALPIEEARLVLEAGEAAIAREVGYWVRSRYS